MFIFYVIHGRPLGKATPATTCFVDDDFDAVEDKVPMQDIIPKVVM